jgi:thioredoxin reductase (NADPH)
MSVYDLIIVGGGPAGLTAAVYACRARLKVALIERLMPGGQVASTEWVENYPGFRDGISGPDLMAQMEAQAKRFGMEVLTDEVAGADLQSQPKVLEGQGGTYTCRTVIFATGSNPKTLDVPGEKEFKGRGVSYCATCDGPFFKDKDVVVIGGGSSGVQESLFLSRFVRSIRLVEIMDHMNAEKILQERARKDPKLSFHLETKLLSIDGGKKVESVSIRNMRTGETQTIKADGVFIWIGFNPNTAFLKKKLDLDATGYICADQDMGTSVSGVYAAGDVRQKSVRQISTAVGDGTVAAESAIHYLESMLLCHDGSRALK